MILSFSFPLAVGEVWKGCVADGQAQVHHVAVLVTAVSTREAFIQQNIELEALYPIPEPGADYFYEVALD